MSDTLKQCRKCGSWGYCYCGREDKTPDVVAFVEQVCDRRLVPWQRRLLVSLTSGAHDLGLGCTDVRRRV
jgi:hypothetical protein